MKKLISGFILGSLLFGSVGAYAASGNLIEVFYTIKAIKIDNVTKTPDKKPFAYEGTTYVPLRFISENLGEEVKWDQKTQTIYIGETMDPSAHYLGDKVNYMNFQEGGYSTFENGYQQEVRIKDNIGNEYENYLTMYTGEQYDQDDWCYIEYPLNGQYSTFNTIVGLTDRYKSTEDVITVEIFADDKVIYNQTFEAGDMPEKISLNIKNSLKLKIKTSGEKRYPSYQVGFFNPHLLK
ncbi:stalk domain-containing protein [Bacillus sp. E(2018)]|uniref:stalk domain-containing protein n=1 Tax=Bacillus sp. E(2018) TaxID=2502239 RepID=UPI0010F8C094|nr:stalk domain-containing protein [Bacillus sp. E(2018)]